MIRRLIILLLIVGCEEADKQFNDYLYPNGKDKAPVKIYDVGLVWK